ncbi:MAG: peptide/nickel transport system substrate-binding protein [Gaiellales bacterium]|jgi:peptide/nickel transport system substrate-binding protein|nr:peptide/nickel transport system substrate-binding protein [Gaiellales bacterium]
MRNRSFLSLTILVVLLATSCGGSSGSSNSSGPSASSGGGRGGTLTLLANSNWGPADPAKNYTLQEWQLLIITNDGLVQFRSTGGAAGTQLLPDLATEIPKPTNGGKTYTFTLRPGIKYSDGTPLKASDFVTVMTRQFTVPGPANGFYEGIVGASACLKSGASCKPSDLSNGVVADDAAGTVTFNLTAPDPEFLYKLSLPFAFAVPGNTSLKDLGNNPPPGTGPYMWKSYDPQHEAVLVRNPFFKVWNAGTQPDGMADEIDYKFGLTVEAEVTQVENGQADWVFDPPPSDRLNELSTQYSNQVHVNPLTAEYYFALNVNIPPFNNQKARQAINFAADRSAYVKIYGGPSLAVPTCQVLPPNFPGYKPYCPYTTNPGDGVWHGPDLAKAKQLVAESGTKGAKVAVVGTTDEVGKAITEQLVNDLNAIGYKATSKLLAGGIQYTYIQNSDNNVQVGYSQWYQDYPAASDFLNVLFGCPGFHPHSDASPNISGFCDKSIQAEMDAALTLGETDPTAANVQWAKIDQQVTDQAPMVQLFNPKLIDFVSKRVKGYAWSPQWYMLFSHLSVK